jgi:hypothetical protein
VGAELSAHPSGALLITEPHSRLVLTGDAELTELELIVMIFNVGVPR